MEWLASYFGAPLLLAAALPLCLEIGFRYGRQIARRTSSAERGRVDSLQSALLAILGLLLAFTFAMATNRYDARKQIRVEESNAIGTAILRTRTLPAPTDTVIREFLHDYVKARVKFDDYATSEQRMAADTTNIKGIQQKIWAATAEAARANPNSVTMALMIQSLNDVFDLQTKYQYVESNHIPNIIIALLTVAAMMALCTIGYNNGLAERRNLMLSFLLGFVIIGTMFLVIDLDRPRRGIILSYGTYYQDLESLF